LFDTNPIAVVSPRLNAEPIVIDLSLSKLARGTDRNGADITDPDAALAGSMVPMGDAKGAALALMVEILKAGLTDSHFGVRASSLFDAEGYAPGV
jgi:(2R)-3-sulfolactate dehydrogenase (NADP+)